MDEDPIEFDPLTLLVILATILESGDRSNPDPEKSEVPDPPYYVERAVSIVSEARKRIDKLGPWWPDKDPR